MFPLNDNLFAISNILRAVFKANVFKYTERATLYNV